MQIRTQNCQRRVGEIVGEEGAESGDGNEDENHEDDESARSEGVSKTFRRNTTR